MADNSPFSYDRFTFSPASAVQTPLFGEPAGSKTDQLSLPTRFDDARQFSLGRKIAKTNSAETELSDVPSGSSANRAAVVSPYLEFGFSHGFVFERSFGQIILLLTCLIRHNGR
jgi:hypothetical protein